MGKMLKVTAYLTQDDIGPALAALADAGLEYAFETSRVVMAGKSSVGGCGGDSGDSGDTGWGEDEGQGQRFGGCSVGGCCGEPVESGDPAVFGGPPEKTPEKAPERLKFISAVEAIERWEAACRERAVAFEIRAAHDRREPVDGSVDLAARMGWEVNEAANALNGLLEQGRIEWDRQERAYKLTTHGADKLLTSMVRRAVNRREGRPAAEGDE